MGLFDKLLGASSNSAEEKEQAQTLQWIPLTSAAQIEEIKLQSKTGYVGVFKHSTRCIISKTVLKRFSESFPKDAKMTLYYLDLLNYRALSNEIGHTFQVFHQSPQFLLIRNKETVFHASHYDITQIDYNKFLK